MNSIADIRKEYMRESLSEGDVELDPILQFTRWWKEALGSDISEVNAMTLATCNASGIPSARTVLLKDYDKKGFVFFTNYQSRKAKDIEENPYATLLFFWKELERQVGIEGRIEKVDAQESDEYFHSRPEGSRIGAWASPQSTVVKNRDEIEENVRLYSDKFSSTSIPRPSHWGGYRVSPVHIEFWQGRPSRLHDRILYTLEDGEWVIRRLAP
jgi:pyridoxamine 5'-phosphate oxidase